MSTAVTTPTLTAGTWTVDAVHSDVSFKVRHMAVGKAKGTFAVKTATLVVGENGLADAAVTAEIDAASVDTKQEQRDAHVAGEGFGEPRRQFQAREACTEDHDMLHRRDDDNAVLACFGLFAAA